MGMGQAHRYFQASRVSLNMTALHAVTSGAKLYVQARLMMQHGAADQGEHSAGAAAGDYPLYL